MRHIDPMTERAYTVVDRKVRAINALKRADLSVRRTVPTGVENVAAENTRRSAPVDPRAFSAGDRPTYRGMRIGELPITMAYVQRTARERGVSLAVAQRDLLAERRARIEPREVRTVAERRAARRVAARTSPKMLPLAAGASDPEAAARLESRKVTAAAAAVAPLCSCGSGIRRATDGGACWLCADDVHVAHSYVGADAAVAPIDPDLL